jgi:hypothetical protein
LEISNIINVPNADSSEEYRVLDAHYILILLKKPNIKKVGTSLVHPGKYIRFSLSQAGFHAQVFLRGKINLFYRSLYS